MLALNTFLQGNFFWADASRHPRQPCLPGYARRTGREMLFTFVIIIIIIKIKIILLMMKVSFAGASLITSFFLARRGKAFLLPGQDIENAVMMIMILMIEMMV